MYIKNDLLQLIVRHDKTFTEKLVMKEKLYFQEVIMLEMFGKWFTSKKSVLPNIVPPRENYLPCLCQEEKPNEQSIFCSNEIVRFANSTKSVLDLKYFGQLGCAKFVVRTAQRRNESQNSTKQNRINQNGSI
jgi:hypothetical protein